MPNQPSAKKKAYSVRLSREMYKRLEKLAVSHQMSVAEFTRHLIYEATEDIYLSPEDYDQIKEEIAAYKADSKQ